MAALQELITEIEALDATAREELFLAIARNVLPFRTGTEAREYSSIVRTPGICGGDARLIRTRITVRSLERLRQLGASEADILQAYPSLRAVDLVQAWAYIADHREEIEAQIRENEED